MHPFLRLWPTSTHMLIYVPCLTHPVVKLSTCSDLYVKRVYDNNSAFASSANAWTGAQKFPLRQGRRNQEQDEQDRAHLNDLSVPPTPAPAPTLTPTATVTSPTTRLLLLPRTKNLKRHLRSGPDSNSSGKQSVP